MSAPRLLAKHVLLATLLIGLSACTPITLIQLDNEWAGTYAALLEAERNRDFLATLTTREQLESGLVDISKRAERAGDEALGRDPRMAVSFYRVAASAAWKSGPRGAHDVDALSLKGIDACERLEQGDASQPRDCTFLKLVPQLYRYDARAREVKGLNASGLPFDQARLQRAFVLAQDMLESMQGVLKVRNDAAGLPLPPSFFDYIATNLNSQYCAVSDLSGAIFQSQPLEADLDRLRRRVAEIDRQLAAASVSNACALTTGISP